MGAKEITVGIGGAAGDGQAAMGDALAKACARLGLYVYIYNSYQSVIRGGHVWLRARIAERKVYNHGDHLTALIALNQDCLNKHANEVDEEGIVLFNGDKISPADDRLKPGVRTIPLPISDLMKPFGRQPAIMQNSIALGSLIWMAQLDFDAVAEVLTQLFARKGDKVVEANVGLCRAGYEYTRRNEPPLHYPWSFSHKRRPLLSGNDCFGIGALAAGCKFYAAYPMTPASSILHFMASQASKYKVLVKQGEDELAVVNMAIGAGHAGVRAMCATSGGGFALMTEGIGMAGMSETPLVVINVQRGGPSTGLPTKTEQGDLNQVLGASQGDYPRMVVAPGDLLEAYEMTVEAFNVAEKYQMPVIILSDLLLSERRETADPEAYNFNIKIDRGLLTVPHAGENGEYLRYKFTESGISPRVLPGQEGTVYQASTDEHDEKGILVSDVSTHPPTRAKMMEKRMRKAETLLQELPPPELNGPADAEVTLIGWGSTKGVILEALERLQQEGISTNYLQIKYLVPFHSKEVEEILHAATRTIVVENNYTGQLARHIRAETGFTVAGHILKYDGEPFKPKHLVAGVKEVINGNSRVTVAPDEYV